MPEVLFCDIDTNKQVDSLLGFLIPKEDCQSSEVKESQECLQPIEDKDRATSALIRKDTGKDVNMNIEKEASELKDAWEEFLSSDGCCDSKGNILPQDQDNIQLSTELEAVDRGDCLARKEQEECNVDTQTAQTKFDKMHSRIFNSKTMQLWMGTRGNVTPLHYDRNHGLLAQISGRKELVLYSHEDTPCLYPHPSYSDRAHTSRVDLRRMHEDSYADLFSKFREAQPHTCILKPGELLYMPPFWWHDVTSLDNCISVTLPWDIEGYEEVPACLMR